MAVTRADWACDVARDQDTLPSKAIYLCGLIKEDGTPFFFLADTVRGLLHFDRADADLYL
jgi:hypothetical protein